MNSFFLLRRNSYHPTFLYKDLQMYIHCLTKLLVTLVPDSTLFTGIAWVVCS